MTTFKTYPDGSKLTGKHLAAGFVGAVIFGTTLFVVKEKIDAWLTKRWMKKNDWPEESINRM